MQIHRSFFEDEKLMDPFIKTQEAVFPRLNLRWALNNKLLPPTTTPFGLFEKGKALSIMTATEMVLNVDDRRYKTVQFGTVATDPGELLNGYSRQLLTQAIAHYRDKTDFIFLYANSDVLEFYPKLGFETVDEYSFFCDINASANPTSPRKLDPNDVVDLAIIEQCFKTRSRLSDSFCIEDYTHLAIWYCMTYMKNALYYFDETQTLLVAEKEKENLIVHDLVAQEIDPSFFEQFSWSGATRAVLNFVPDKFNGAFTQSIKPGISDPLFVMGSFPVIKDRPLAIPTLAHT